MAGLAIRVNGETVPLGDAGPFVIGTSPDASLRLDDERVAAEHLILTGLGEAWLACDLGTPEGTYVDGERVEAGKPLEVSIGIEFRLGDPKEGVSLKVVSSKLEPSESGPRRVSEQAIPVGTWRPSRPSAVAPTPAPKQRGRVTSVGRRPDNDLVINDSTVSSHHALIVELSPGQLLVQDLNSTNGTFVDGEQVARQEVGEGSLVCFGRARFRVSADGLERVRSRRAGKPC